MNFLKSLLNKTKSELDVWFFYGFLLTFTLSIRKVLFYFPIKGAFNEYSGIYLYASDIFLFLTLLSWQVYILCNKSVSLSNVKLWISKLFHNLYIFIPFVLVIWAFISIIWSQNQAISLFRSIKLLELYLLYLYIIFRIVPRGTISVLKRGISANYSTPAPLVSNVPRGTFDTFAGWNNLFLVIIGLGFIQSFLGIIQFIEQKSIGLPFLRESLIGPDIPGVAKIILNGHKYIRSYGLFPHPNILGGFLIVSIVFTLLYLKLFHVEQFKVAKNKEIFIKAILLVQIFGLILTFSKSAILGLIIGLVYIYWRLIVPRGTIQYSRIKILFHVEQLRILIPATLILLVSLFFIFKPNLNSFFIQSIEERVRYLNVSRGTILENPILGLGAGQFVISMQKFSPVVLQNWQYQPVHNLFLLIWTELGFVGLVLFTWILWDLFHLAGGKIAPCHKELKRSTLIPLVSNVPRLSREIRMFHVEHSDFLRDGTITNIYFKAILIGLIFISLFDHYPWSIQQGGFLLWITLGLITGIARIQAKRGGNSST